MVLRTMTLRLSFLAVGAWASAAASPAVAGVEGSGVSAVDESLIRSDTIIKVLRKAAQREASELAKEAIADAMVKGEVAKDATGFKALAQRLASFTRAGSTPDSASQTILEACTEIGNYSMGLTALTLTPGPYTVVLERHIFAIDAISDIACDF